MVLDGDRPIHHWHLQPSSGEAETLPEAKAAFRVKFDAWLTWAKDLGHTALPDQVYRLKLELAAELPSLQWTPPVPLNTLPR